MKTRRIKVSTDLAFAIVSSVIGAIAGIARALSNYNGKIEKRFQSVENDLDNFQDRVIHDYVLKEDFLREMQAVHNKLDRILDHILTKGN